MSPRTIYENPLPFPPTNHTIRRACSVASPRAGRLLRRLAAWPSPCRLLRRLATCRPPSPSRRFCSSAPEDQEGRDPLSCKALYLRAPAAALVSWRQVLELLVLELLLQTLRSSSRPRAPRPRAAAEVNDFCCSSRFSSSSPSSLHRRRRRRLCFCCPLAHGSAGPLLLGLLVLLSAIGGGLGAEEWMLLPLIKEFCV